MIFKLLLEYFSLFLSFQARVSQDTEHFLLNPFGMMYSEVTASSLVKVNMQGETVEEARKYLGRFGLSGDLALNPIGVLSGGQKSRLAFAELAWRSRPH